MKISSSNSKARMMVGALIKYNLVIFVILIAIGLMGSVYILTNISSRPYTESPATSQNTPSFDNPTMNRLAGLEFSSSNVNYKSLPTGRVNPFSE